MDKIKVCGRPYYEWLGRRLKITEVETFNSWFSLANSLLKDVDIQSIFASTLVMDGLFGYWASKNFDKVEGSCGEDWKDGVEESTRYGGDADSPSPGTVCNPPPSLGSGNEHAMILVKLLGRVSRVPEKSMQALPRIRSPLSKSSKSSGIGMGEDVLGNVVSNAPPLPPHAFPTSPASPARPARDRETNERCWETRDSWAKKRWEEVIRRANLTVARMRC
ncbi:hypothetical protein P154DRAFT_606297 [Amniculicola lignicola CBS 123094]|uniref:Uncharacterized protein n=1 Tax=Amniculicola lignicola CBS 123094 TaxID=1392246 RepID=A0A6A5WYW9_9PLEO|nr:hypothetical protein P154DRAFT_606297 [Amniculicola lignicola CBS 123094]